MADSFPPSNIRCRGALAGLLVVSGSVFGLQIQTHERKKKIVRRSGMHHVCAPPPTRTQRDVSASWTSSRVADQLELLLRLIPEPRDLATKSATSPSSQQPSCGQFRIRLPPCRRMEWLQSSQLAALQRTCPGGCRGRDLVQSHQPTMPHTAIR